MPNDRRSDLLERREFAKWMVDQCRGLGLYESIDAFQALAAELAEEAIALPVTPSPSR